MRVISGRCKGRTLIGPRSDQIRPALDKVKQALFNILEPIAGTRVLDLFAGTGSIGIEALSRDAVEAIFVDGGEEALKIIRKNLELCSFQETGKIIRARLPQDLPKLKKRLGTYDLIFVDPPYDKNLVNSTLRALAPIKLLADNGIVIVEHSPREPIAKDCGWNIFDQRKYGQTWISFLKEKTLARPGIIS